MEQNNLFKEYEGIFAPTLEEVGGPTKSVGQAKKGRTFGFSPFALQDAVGERNVKKIWIEYQKLRITDGITAEEIIHKIVGKVRDMVAIINGASKEDLTIQNDWQYNKSKTNLKNWKPGELKIFYAKLVEIYHKSRMESDNELDVALEKTLLSI
jgi:hypothetical protein